LKTTLVTAAWSAVRVKATYLRAQFERVRARRGAKKAIIAVAASMLTAAYFMLRDGVPYRDLGPTHIDERHRQTAIQRLLRRLNDLGYQPAPQGSAS
jgi:transposase